MRFRKYGHVSVVLVAQRDTAYQIVRHQDPHHGPMRGATPIAGPVPAGPPCAQRVNIELPDPPPFPPPISANGHAPG
jgi:hypothetical protein